MKRTWKKLGLLEHRRRVSFRHTYARTASDSGRQWGICKRSVVEDSRHAHLQTRTKIYAQMLNAEEDRGYCDKPTATVLENSEVRVSVVVGRFMRGPKNGTRRNQPVLTGFLACNLRNAYEALNVSR